MIKIGDLVVYQEGPDRWVSYCLVHRIDDSRGWVYGKWSASLEEAEKGYGDYGPGHIEYCQVVKRKFRCIKDIAYA